MINLAWGCGVFTGLLTGWLIWRPWRDKETQ